jgi:transposase
MTQKQAQDAYKQFMGHLARLSWTGLTMAQIARELGVHERTIYKWTSRQRKVGPLLLLALERVVDEKGA